MACSPVPKVGEAAAPSAPPVPTPMIGESVESLFRQCVECTRAAQLIIDCNTCRAPAEATSQKSFDHRLSNVDVVTSDD